MAKSLADLTVCIFDVGLTKSLLNRAFDTTLEAALEGEAFALELSSRTQDFKEGLAAFAEKRAPRYRGH